MACKPLETVTFALSPRYTSINGGVKEKPQRRIYPTFNHASLIFHHIPRLVTSSPSANLPCDRSQPHREPLRACAFLRSEMQLLRFLFRGFERGTYQSLYRRPDPRIRTHSPRPQAKDRVLRRRHPFPDEPAPVGTNPEGDGTAPFARSRRMDCRVQSRHRFSR